MYRASALEGELACLAKRLRQSPAAAFFHASRRAAKEVRFYRPGASAPVFSLTIYLLALGIKFNFEMFVALAHDYGI